MDEFDTKINKMQMDIDLIKFEINDIQKKNKESKGYLRKSIDSLSINNTIDYSGHQYKKELTAKTRLSKERTKTLSKTSKDTFREENPNHTRHKMSIDQSSVLITDQNDDIIDEIKQIFHSKLSIKDMIAEIKLNKQKEELATLVSSQFNLGKCDLKKSFGYVTKFMSKSETMEKIYQEEIKLYQNMCEELLRRNPAKIDENQLKSYFNKIYTVENEIGRSKHC